MLLGAYLAIRQDILKRLLAYSTVSALGVITMLLGIGSKYAAAAAVTFLFAHALYKAALFLVAGIIDHETGERNVRRLGGLAKSMPITTAGAAAAGLSMAGIPLLFGFVAKELVYESVLHAPGAALLLTALTVLSSMFFFVVAACVAYRPFYGAHLDTPRHPHEAPASMWLGPVMLGMASLLFGFFPALPGGSLLSGAAASVLGKESHLHLALWHGLNPALFLSVLTVAGGLLVYRYRDTILGLTEGLQRAARFGPERGYAAALNGLVAVSKWQTRLLQNGYLRYYLLTIVLTTLFLTYPVLLTERRLVSETFYRHLLESLQSLHLYELGLALVLVLAIGAAVHSKTRLAAVAALGLVGFGIALIFIFFGAPDLAMTQFVIETLTVILLVLTFYHLPPFSILPSRPVLIRDLSIAIGVGLS
jgi:multicomponent Na+:H+ antiporter subunit A